jgi:hypothetical protein
MGYQFPNTPVEGDVYTPATGAPYTFREGVWRRGSDTTTSGYVLKTGDTMSGALSLPAPDPVGTQHATHKQYVDKTVAAAALYQGTWQVAANVPDLNVPPNSPLNLYSWTAQTANPAIPEVAPATLPGIGGLVVQALDTIKWIDATQAYELVRGAVGVSQMTIADAPPPAAFHGQQWFDSDSGKNYVHYDDGTSRQWVQTSGGGGASKAEVYFGDVPPDPTFDGELWWDTTTGNMMINYGGTWVQTNVEEAPIDGLQYVRSSAAWVVSTTTAITDSPADGGYYGRKDGTWKGVLGLSGGTVVGNLNVAPAASLCLEINNGDVSAIVVEAKVAGASTQCDIRASQNNSAQPSGIWEFWTANGMYGGPAWALKTTIAAPPGIDVNGTSTALNVVSRSLAEDPASGGDGDIGKLLLKALARIASLEARLAKAKL